MKLKQLLLLVVLFITSCKVTEKNVVGNYTSDQSADLQQLTLFADHTFLYENCNFLDYWSKKQDIDSCIFINRGRWALKEKKLILNSFENPPVDTDRMVKILKTRAETKESHLLFEDLNGNRMTFNRVDDEKGNFAFIVDRTYSDIDINLAKHKLMTFYFDTYKPWTFVVRDTSSANYVITLAPIYKQRRFNNKSFSATVRRLKSNKIIFKKENVQRIDSSKYMSTAHF